jgi:hypothetical protein
MAKLYDARQHKIRYSLPADLYFAIEEDYFELCEILATERLDGHDRYDQWQMKLHLKMEELLDAMNELDEETEDLYKLTPLGEPDKK